MLKAISTVLIATATASLIVAPAGATGMVYGNYGQNNPGYQQTGSSSCDEGDEVAGTIIGGVIGGVIGNQFGKGSGKTAATVGGVILGGIAGNQIAKGACRDNRKDAYYYNDTYSDALNSGDDGQEYEWRNPYTDNYGYVTPGSYYEEGYNGYSGPCRQFSQRVYIDGHPETAYGVACRQPDGSWRIVNGN